MELKIVVRDRFRKHVEVRDEKGRLLLRKSSRGDLFPLLCRSLTKAGFAPEKFRDVSVSASGKSQTTDKIAYAVANAFAYTLSLKKLSELSFPKKPEGFPYV